MEKKKYVDFDKVITTYKTFGHLNLHNVLEAFNEIPAADVQPITHGKWKEIKTGFDLFDYQFECSICHGWTPNKAYVIAPDFCPNCGADMRGINE